MLAAGTRLGPYEIQALIGAGGMGQVYKALDTRLHRTVAIKQLSAQHDTRFAQEARAIAALNHPNICQLYDIGDDYLVLEYVEGAPLSGPLPEPEVVALATQLADALETAHRRGILHRDLKPANLLLTPAGTAKLLDFGVAQLLDRDVDLTKTSDRVVVGTVAYMSPEQAMGKPLDARSDVFSLGIVLYELMAGRRAFEGDTSVQVLSAVLTNTPEPLATAPMLNRVIMRCLDKDPDLRFQSMAEMREALETGASRPAAVQPSIAVLPFANLSADRENEYFADGLAEEIINALSHVPGIKVIARTSAFAFKGRPDDVRRIAKVLGVNHVLEGGVRRAGDRIRVTAQLIGADDGSQIWSDRYDRSMSDVFAMQDEIAGAITMALKGRLGGNIETMRQRTPSLPAYEALLRGRHHLFKFTPDSWRKARASFEEAIALDAGYAEPHADLGLGFFIAGMHGMMPLRAAEPFVRAEGGRALELNPSDSVQRFLLGAMALVHDYDWPAGEAHFRAAMAAPQVTSYAHWAHASFYLGALGRFAESAAEMGKAVDLDPLNATWRAIWAAHLGNAMMHERAIEEGRKAVELEENYFVSRITLGEAYLGAGRRDEAIVPLEEAHRLGPWNAMATGLLAAAHALNGNRTRAVELIREMGDAPQPVWGRVWYHLYVKELDAAAEWFDRMIDERDPFALAYANAPVTQPLHRHPAWPALAARMRLPRTIGLEARPG
jgi:serine/threonine-protein kinase